MKIFFSPTTCTIEREDGDPTFPARVRDGAGESLFLYHVKKKLQAEGFDVIKKRMNKDGHLVSDCQQYIRSRKPNETGAFCIFNPHFAIRDANEDFNRGRVVLSMISFDSGVST